MWSTPSSPLFLFMKVCWLLWWLLWVMIVCLCVCFWVFRVIFVIGNEIEIWWFLRFDFDCFSFVDCFGIECGLSYFTFPFCFIVVVFEKGVMIWIELCWWWWERWNFVDCFSNCSFSFQGEVFKLMDYHQKEEEGVFHMNLHQVEKECL